MRDKPIFKHNCDQCVFLGVDASGRFDMYWCSSVRHDGPLVRFGDADIFYTHGMMSVGSGKHCNEAFLRACVEGLVPTHLMKAGIREIEMYERMALL